MRKNFYPEKCTPYADGRSCKMRPVLDGEYWCETHQQYQWRRWEWRIWEQNLKTQKEKEL